MATKKKLTKPAPSRTTSAESTRDIFLRVTVQMIDTYGESAVKLDDVLTKSNASVSSLYHHFGSLRGLVEEAQVQRFMMARYLDIDRLRTGIEKMHTKAEFIELVDSVASGMISDGRTFNRMRRITALGSSESNNSMREKLVRLERESLENVVESLKFAQARGFISKTVDVEAATLWGTTVAFSRALIEILDNQDLLNRWDVMAKRSIMQAFGLVK